MKQATGNQPSCERASRNHAGDFSRIAPSLAETVLFDTSLPCPATIKHAVPFVPVGA